MRVLVIEDNPDGAVSLEMVLIVWGHEVRVAGNGLEGVRVAREWSPDVVLCDIGLPGLNGFEVAQMLRANTATAGVRMIAVTGYADGDTVRRALSCGCERLLAKPADPEELKRVLAHPMDLRSPSRLSPAYSGAGARCVYGRGYSPAAGSSGGSTFSTASFNSGGI